MDSIKNAIATRKKEITLLFFSLVVGLVVGAVILEIYFQKNIVGGDTNIQFDAELGWATIPNRSIVVDGKKYSTNADGLRSEEAISARRHILIVGDSVAYGSGVNDDETVAAYLGRKFKDYQVLNFGVSGYGIDQYYLVLKRQIKKTNPALVVVVICAGNDFEDTATDFSERSKPLFSIEYGQLKLINGNISRYSCPNLFSRSWLLSSYPFNRLRDFFCKPRKLDEDSARSTIAALLEKIANFAGQHGAKTMFVLSPSKIDVVSLSCVPGGTYGGCAQLIDKDISFFKEIVAQEKRRDPTNYPLFALRRYFGNRSRLFTFLDIFAKNDLAYLNFIAKLMIAGPKIGDVYVDNHHYSPYGNELLAEAIYGYSKAGSWNMLNGADGGVGRDSDED